MTVDIFVESNGTLYKPVVEDGVTWETERKGTPGKCTFKVVPATGELNIQEGNAVRLHVDGADIFYGYVFQKKRSEDKIITITAYDQLRYLKNKDTYRYENSTATEVVQMLAKDFRLQTGELENTGWKIASRLEDNKTLFDIIQYALDLTVESTNRLYVLYDDFGKLTLKNIESMHLDILVNADNAQSFDYTSSIDGETYNKIKLQYDNKEAGSRDTYIAQNGELMNAWGVLQYFEKIDENVNGPAKADAMLALYGHKTRDLQVKNVFGDIRVRAGCGLYVALDLGDVVVNQRLVVEKVKHDFSENLHTMDLTLRGNNFRA